MVEDCFEMVQDGPGLPQGGFGYVKVALTGRQMCPTQRRGAPMRLQGGFIFFLVSMTILHPLVLVRRLQQSAMSGVCCA